MTRSIADRPTVELNRLFVEYLRHSKNAHDAVGSWVRELDDCDEAPEAAKAATFRYVTAIHRELLDFIGKIDFEAAAMRFQE
jgi:hypothetical protein